MSYSLNRQDSRFSYDSAGENRQIVHEEELEDSLHGDIDSGNDHQEQFNNNNNNNNSQSSAPSSNRQSAGFDYYEKDYHQSPPELITTITTDNGDTNATIENGQTSVPEFQMSVTDNYSTPPAPAKVVRQISFEQDKRTSVQSSGNDQNLDWVKTTNREKGKVSDLVKRFNNYGAESNSASNQAKYKQDYGLGKSVGQIRQIQNKFQ